MPTSDSSPKTSPYDLLLSPLRQTTTSIPGRTFAEEMLSDTARVITSAAFRRLQTKAQVFSLEENAAVRSRLTHTMEVSTYGGLIARKVADALRKKFLITEDQASGFVTVVENSCLLHDIGNPPFGHLGEFAIQKWFSDNYQKLTERWQNHGIPTEVIQSNIAGFRFFDGNPQAIRIVSRLLWWRDEHGLNLTFALIASIVKYLGVEPHNECFGKKPGYFASEGELIKEIWTKLGLRHDGRRPLQRHPLAFLMEAADDIAYCVSDIEDAIEKRVVREEDFLIEAKKVIDARFFDEPPEGTTWLTGGRFVGFRIRLTRHLVQRAADLYIEHELALREGTCTMPLLEMDAECNAALDWLKKYSKKNIFLSKEAVNVELSGFRIVTGLLDAFACLIFAGQQEFERLLPDSRNPPGRGEMALQLRMASLLSQKHVRNYRFEVSKNSNLEPIYRVHLIIGYLSGMTDSHALKVYRMIQGVLPGEH